MKIYSMEDTGVLQLVRTISTFTKVKQASYAFYMPLVVRARVESITKINDTSFATDDAALNKQRFDALIDQLTTGAVLHIEYYNEAKQSKTVDITVSEVAYPGFTLTVTE